MRPTAPVVACSSAPACPYAGTMVSLRGVCSATGADVAYSVDGDQVACPQQGVPLSVAVRPVLTSRQDCTYNDSAVVTLTSERVARADTGLWGTSQEGPTLLSKCLIGRSAGHVATLLGPRSRHPALRYRCLRCARDSQRAVRRARPLRQRRGHHPARWHMQRQRR